MKTRKTVNFHKNFEDVYLRHDYLKKIKPEDRIDSSVIKRYQPIIYTTANIMLKKHAQSFQPANMDLYDIMSIASVYAYIYLSSYSIVFNKKANQAFIEKKGILPEEEMSRKDRNNLINFMRQKLSMTAIICGRKNRSTTGRYVKISYFAKTSISQEKSLDAVARHPTKYGYRRMVVAEFMALKKEKATVDSYGFEYYAINIGSQAYGTENVIGSLYSEDNGMIFKNPEQILIHNEEELYSAKHMNDFSKMSAAKKASTLRKFIRANQDNRHYEKEISLAKRMVGKIEKGL